mmetsp:Transcript_37082/g.86502  ORF Transcript_37082/g.86502 Transcript_37082/m.86502 type:complete len:80 (+) Transcript_37082:249-488(+)
MIYLGCGNPQNCGVDSACNLGHLDKVHRYDKEVDDGTGGRLGAPEDFVEWNKRDNSYQNDYCNDRWLCWVYMIDHSIGY